MKQAIFLLTCLDQKGIVAQFTSLLFKYNVNIINLEQHVEFEENLFFMRIDADLRNISISVSDFFSLVRVLEKTLKADLLICNPLKKINVAIFCTKESAHVLDLLIKEKCSELNCVIPLIISNHKTIQEIIGNFPIKFFYVPVNSDCKSHESKMNSILESHSIDLIVLARYMQILSNEFVEKYSGKIINIHHSFLPAFKGKKPYHKAWEKGVKIIGATAHYVTEELDEGPIICQDVVPVSHHYSVKKMIQAGRDVERRVLSNAVKAHLEHRIILHRNRTLIFNG